VVVTGGKKEDISISELRGAVDELKKAVAYVRDHRQAWHMPITPVSLAASGWNFETFEKYINQRFGDLSLQLRERYEAQQTGVTAALAAAEKAVNAALIAAEKAVDKAERAQELRNQVANEFRESLSDLSSLMWTSKEGMQTVESLRREFSTIVDNIDKKVAALAVTRSDATEAMRQGLEVRIAPLELGYANIQGRIWSVSALFAIAVLAVSIGVRFIGH
jgi:hypothetical protein